MKAGKRPLWRNIPLSVYPVAVTAALMLPIIIAAAYTHPWWDDYVYTIPTRRIFLQGGGAWELVKQAAAVSYDKYLNWSGAFAHQFLASLEPHFIDYHAYQAAMVLTVLAFIASLYYFVFTANRFLVGLTPWKAAAAGSAIILLSAYLMPTPHEFFFWLTGACNYTWVICALALGAGFAIRMVCAKSGPSRWLYFAGAALAAVMIGGSNHSTALFTSCLLGCVWILYLRFGETRLSKVLMTVLLGLSCIALALNVLAPGNAYRMANSEQMSPPAAVSEAVVHMLKTARGWILGIPGLAAVLFAPMFWREMKGSRFSFPMPGAVLFASFLLLCSQYVPTFYGASDAGPGRVHDCVYIIFCFWLFGNLIYLLGWTAKRNLPRVSPAARSPVLKALLLAAAVLLTVKPQAVVKSNGIVALRQLISGEIQTYDREMTAIYEALRASPGEDVTAPDLTVSPIVRAGSFGKNAEDIRNAVAAEFFGCKSFRVE